MRARASYVYSNVSYVVTRIYKPASFALRQITRAIQAIYSYPNKKEKIIEVRDKITSHPSVQAVAADLEGIPQTIHTLRASPDSKMLLNGSAYNFVKSVAPIIVYENIAAPLLATYLPYLWLFPYGLGLFLIAQECWPNATPVVPLLYSSIIEASIRKGLRDRCAAKIAEIIKANYSMKLEAALQQVPRVHIIQPILHETLGHVLTDIFLRMTKDKAFMKEFSQKNKPTDDSFDVLTKKPVVVDVLAEDEAKKEAKKAEKIPKKVTEPEETLDEDFVDVAYPSVVEPSPIEEETSQAEAMDDAAFLKKLFHAFPAYFREHCTEQEFKEHLITTVHRFFLELKKNGVEIMHEVEVVHVLNQASDSIFKVFQQNLTDSFGRELWRLCDADVEMRRLFAILPSLSFHSTVEVTALEAGSRSIFRGFELGGAVILQGWLRNPLLDSFLAGNLLMQQKFDVGGMTSQEVSWHRSKNKLYALLLGASMISSVYGVQGLLSYFFGTYASSFFTSSSVYYLIYNAFSANTLLSDRRYPGHFEKHKGLDLYYLFEIFGKGMAQAFVYHLATEGLPELELKKTSQEEAKANVDAKQLEVKAKTAVVATQLEAKAKTAVVATQPEAEPKTAAKQLEGQQKDAKLEAQKESALRELSAILFKEYGSIKSLDEAMHAIVKIEPFNLFLKLKGRPILAKLANFEQFQKTFEYKFLLSVLHMANFYNKNLGSLFNLIQEGKIKEAISIFKELVHRAENYRNGKYLVEIPPLNEDMLMKNIKPEHGAVKIPDEKTDAMSKEIAAAELAELRENASAKPIKRQDASSAGSAIKVKDASIARPISPLRAKNLFPADTGQKGLATANTTMQNKKSTGISLSSR